MKIKYVSVNRYKTEMDFEIQNNFEAREQFSEEYQIDDLVKFQIKVKIHSSSNDTARNTQNNFTFGPHFISTSSNNSTNKWTIRVSAKFINIKSNTSTYIQLSSRLLDIQNMCINADSNWHLIIGECVSDPVFDLYFTIDTHNDYKLKLLHDDEQLTDFELRGDDCSVKVHKCILAATTPVFQNMLQGDWKETRNGYMKLEGMSKTALQDFKRYIYLNTLPTTVSEQVLLIAMRYQITDMEMACIKTMIKGLNAKNMSDLLDFAVYNKCDRLKIAILECVQKGTVKVDEIKTQLNRNYTQKTL